MATVNADYFVRLFDWMGCNRRTYQLQKRDHGGLLKPRSFRYHRGRLGGTYRRNRSFVFHEPRSRRCRLGARNNRRTAPMVSV